MPVTAHVGGQWAQVLSSGPHTPYEYSAAPCYRRTVDEDHTDITRQREDTTDPTLRTALLPTTRQPTSKALRLRGDAGICVFPKLTVRVFF